MVITAGLYSAAAVIGVIVVVTILGCLLTIVTILTRPNLRKLVNVPLVSLSCAGLLYAICGPALWIHHFLHPQWEPPVALCWFESRNRVMANAENDANRLAVRFTGGERGEACGKGDDAGPSASTATVHSLISPRKASDGGVWMGDDRSSSGDEEQNTDDQNKPGKPKVIFLAPPAANHARTDKQQRASQGSSSQHNAAERQITKMMMTLFAIFTACCMPMTLMVMIHDKVPPEAFMVGSIMMALNGALNPIVYGLMNKNIRQGYKHIWERILNYIT
ncbi:GPR84 [Branchiostoma lanceolatum]|uniref:GPR84 protein n=1 Tax=Branchiostoma lanceolatum TaxID=7740 RepID=A0A8K0EA74_BRALA|nr:GPR84 [Branchiostoma lanceolatum]